MKIILPLLQSEMGERRVKRFLFCSIIMMAPFVLVAQTVAISKVNRQQKFAQELPAGNYSGITWIGDDRFAVVSDKGDDGFYVFRLQIDKNKGKILQAQNMGFHATGELNGDIEGIVYVPDMKTVFVCSEAQGTVCERGMDGKLTGRSLSVPKLFQKNGKNTGLESLAYDRVSHLFWTTSESTLDGDGLRATSVNGIANKLRLQSFGEDLKPREQYAYLMDVPKTRKAGRQFAHGVSEITALDDGQLLVLEREMFVTKRKIGSYVICKLYVVNPDEGRPVGDEPLNDATPYLKKKLLGQWKTRMNLLHQNLANYEGMCLGPELADGRQTLLLVADSQNQYGGLLRDWFKCIVLK